ncbi:NADH dehydrogenase [Cytobacillus eiseniae]|uniref:NADH dehydrogenase n=1 Tax=Cytobacillus eiseniae TaxID=762947 RepID=A0ABS4RKJ4_9BACI|nr:NAD(P)/FAD-dependent oxidoreductase [Cytobacillus eiseniae]MBP2242819.1 NADH dehydrogenase [Cytobacillus eiseniae]
MGKPKVIILGAGYGGMIVSRELEKTLMKGEADVTLINKHDYHYISTQLHKIGAGTVSDDHVALHIPDLLKTNHVKFMKATVKNTDFTEKKIILESGEIVEYDYLLIALGFDVDTFGIPGVEEFAFKIRSFRSSKAIHYHIRKEFAAYKEDLDSSHLTFVVAGAGFTGIEMVGELVDQLPKLCKEYAIPYKKIRIINVESSDSILPFFDRKAIDFTSAYLQKNSVELMTSTKIIQCKKDAIILDNGFQISARTLIWSGGVRANRLLEQWDLQLINGRIPVDKYLRVNGLDGVFCVGDAAYFLNEDEKALPATAQVAIQQAQVCGPNIAAAIRGQGLKPFTYHHKGTVASIGSKVAVGNVFGLKMTGFFAALMKQVVEARYLFVLGGPVFMAKVMLAKS